MTNATITGWGKALPPSVLSNEDLESFIDTSDEWITSRTGIKERRISHVETSDMATIAAHRALAAAGLEPDDVDLIIVATCSPDTLIPSAAAYVQAKLGAKNAGAVDLNAACSGFIYSLVFGANMIRGGTHKRVLVIGAEKLHYYMDFTDRTTSVLFGDGAGAVVLEPTDGDEGLLSSELGMDGEASESLCIPGYGTRGDRAADVPSEVGVRMDGPEVFRRAVTMMGGASVRVVEKAGIAFEAVDILIPHQANRRIIDATARKLKLPSERVFMNIGDYGNTSAATIPIALTEALEQGRIRPGANIVFAAFGGGLSWAAAVLRWGQRTEPLGTSDVDFPPTDRTTLELLQPNFDFFGLEPK
jgi:3-oxoacyl-[acyl-carrier-protein] synthase-3